MDSKSERGEGYIDPWVVPWWEVPVVQHKGHEESDKERNRGRTIE